MRFFYKKDESEWNRGRYSPLSEVYLPFLLEVRMRFREYVKEQIELIKDRDPAMKEDREVFLYPSFWALWEYQRAHKY